MTKSFNKLNCGFTLIDPGSRTDECNSDLRDRLSHRGDMAVQGKAGKKGFTLIELLVAIALFSILVAIAVGGFVRALHTQRQVASLIGAQSNIAIALEQMSREIRTATDICPISGGTSPCTCSSVDPAADVETCQTLAFTNANGQAIVYALQSGTLAKSVDGGTTFNPLTTSDVGLSYFETTIFGAVAGDHWPARVTLVLGITPTDPALKNNILNLQTTVSARQIDCDAGGNC